MDKKINLKNLQDINKREEPLEGDFQKAGRSKEALEVANGGSQLEVKRGGRNWSKCAAHL